jgi:hypothetical protein
MKIPRPLLLVPLLFTLVMTSAGFTRGCSSEEKRTAQQNVTLGVRVAVRAVPAGIETMRTLREHGKVEAETNRLLAERALEFNSALRRFSQAALDGNDATTLSEQLGVVVTLAQNLERDGTLHLKNGETRLVFELLAGGAKNGLMIAMDELKGQSGGAPVQFNLDEATKQSLRDLMPAFEENDRLLRDAVKRLSP